MKHLPIQSPSLEYVLKSYREWLDIQGYAATTVESLPNHLREFFHYIEQQHNVTQVQQIKAEQFTAYCEQLKSRQNLRRGGGLSNAYLNKHNDALTRFIEYLKKTSRLELPHIKLHRNNQNSKSIDVVSVDEIQALFTACDDHLPASIYDAIAWRDKALLVVFYCCGLRRKEGYHLDLSDISLDTRLLHVRKGKGYKERFVPFNQTSAGILQTYIYDYRPCFKRANELNALFVSAKGLRMGHLNTSLRLQALIQRTHLPDFKQKDVSLHTLRHSIATHLLQAGMPLEKISRFLGHSSLESTQIYTHLCEALERREAGPVSSLEGGLRRVTLQLLKSFFFFHHFNCVSDFHVNNIKIVNHVAFTEANHDIP